MTFLHNVVHYLIGYLGFFLCVIGLMMSGAAVIYAILQIPRVLWGGLEFIFDDHGRHIRNWCIFMAIALVTVLIGWYLLNLCPIPITNKLDSP